MSKKRESPVGVKIIACLLMLGSLAALLLPWMKLGADVGANQIRMSPGELIQNFAGMDSSAVKQMAMEEMAASGVQADAGAMNDLMDRLLDGRFRPHELGILCRDVGDLCRAMQRTDLGGTMDALGYGLWGLFGLLALLGVLALICQLTDHRGGMLPYFLLGALITAGLVFLRREMNAYLVQESETMLESMGLKEIAGYLGIQADIVKMGIGAYLCPFLALLALLLMGIRKKGKKANYQASPYPARRAAGAPAAGQQPRPAQRPAQSGTAQRAAGAATQRKIQSEAGRTEQSRPQPASVPQPGTLSWECPYCGRRMEADKNFCDLCGSPRPRRQEADCCRVCGSKLRPGARFCGNCGSSIAQSDLGESLSLPKKEN